MAYIIGDGESWYAEVGNIHNRTASQSDKAQLRKKILVRIQKYRSLLQDESQRELLRKLELAIVGDDDAMYKSTLLWGLKPSEGLFEKIREIVMTVK